ncbi:hypothetical protein EOD40_05830 [Flavobacterium sufflavum]|uniref:Uncharacterized protein n=1 Tax=Flavobacterium sufflavum TaxID=1921138 RepID=A0A437KXQ0_9FLAO|nr:hypothetical protein [Flavobacterium sufflavum]RVT77332.1 hypothetical protein EOD40_05830 [Flavobacterium sufflavum]
MLDQLEQLAKEFGADAVIKNEAIPNEQNEAVLKETSSSIFSSLQKIAAKGDLSEIVGLLQGKDINEDNPAVQEITNQVSNSLTEKLGLSSDTAHSTATTMIPQILNSLITKANDPKDKSFSVSDLLNSLTGGDSPEHAGIMETIRTYGIHFGLDQNSDGKLDVDDAVELTKKGGLSGMLGKLFGK